MKKRKKFLSDSRNRSNARKPFILLYLALGLLTGCVLERTAAKEYWTQYYLGRSEGVRAAYGCLNRYDDDSAIRKCLKEELDLSEKTIKEYNKR